MKNVVLLLLSLFYKDWVRGQRIQVRIPYQVSVNYKYAFVNNDREIIGIPGEANLLKNTGRFCIWDAGSGKFIHGFEKTNISNFSTTFSSDGKLFALHPSAKELFIGNVEGDSITDELAFHPSVVLRSDVKFSPDGNFVVYKTDIGSDSIIIYDIVHKTRYPIAGIFDLSMTRFSTDGQYVSFISFDHGFELIRLSDRKLILKRHFPEEINQTNIYAWEWFSLEDSLLQIIDDRVYWLINISSGSVRRLNNVIGTTVVKGGRLAFMQDTMGKKKLIAYDLSTEKCTQLTSITADRTELTQAGDYIVLMVENDLTDITYSVYNRFDNKLNWSLGHKYNNEIVRKLIFSRTGRYCIVQTVESFYLLESTDHKLIRRISYLNQYSGREDAFFSGDEKKIGIKDNVSVTIYTTKNGFKVATLQNGGNSQDYTIMDFTGDSRNIPVNTFTNGIVRINIDSAIVKLPKSVSADDYSIDRKRFVRSNFMGNISLFDAVKNTEIKNINLDITGFNIRVFPKGHYFAEYDAMPDKMYLFDINNGNKIWERVTNADYFDGPYIFDAYDKIFIAKTSGSYDVYELATGRLLGRIMYGKMLTKPIIDEKSRYIYLVDSSGKLIVYDVMNGVKPVQNIPVDDHIRDLHYSSFADSFRCIWVGNYGAGKFTDTFYHKTEPVNYLRGDYLVRESPDHAWLLVYYGLDDIEVWDTRQKKLATTINVGRVQIADFFISPDNKWIVVQGLQKELHMYNFENKSLVGTFYFFNSAEKQLAFIREDGYYKIDKGIANNIRFSIDGTVYDFDQLDLRFNRPDKVIESLGNTNAGLINSYYTAYQKRIERMKIDTEQFTNDLEAPVTEIENERELENKMDNDQTVRLKIHAYDKSRLNYLQRIFITVNGNPVYGTLGLNIEPFHSRDTVMAVSLDLAPGNNTIKVSCLNNRAVESFRTNLNLAWMPAKSTRGHTWFIGIGVADYKNAAYKLLYPCKNILQLDSLFSKENKNNYSSILRLDSSAVKRNIIDIKKELLAKVQPGDRVILAFSGHGIVYGEKEQKSFYYATYDMNFKDPSEHGISYEEIEWLLDSIPAQNKLVLMDACKSGELDNDGTNNGNFELMQELFSNTSRGNGATIIAASAGDKAAYEPKDLGNSIFMHFILEGLKGKKADINGNGEITINELQTYVNREVSLFSENEQKPAPRIVNYDNDWILSGTINP